MRQQGNRSGTWCLDSQASALTLHPNPERRCGPRYVHATTLGSLPHADTLSSVAILESLQVRRDADARQPGIGNRHAVPVALPGIRLDTGDAARDLPARRDYVCRRLCVRTGTRTRPTRRAGPGRYVSVQLMAIAACGHGSPQLSVDSIYSVDSRATADVVQVASMASRDTRRIAMRADPDGRQLWIRFCRDADSDRIHMVRGNQP